MSKEEGGNALRGGAGHHPDTSNAGGRQRSSGHLVVPVWSTTEVGRAMIFRTSCEVNRRGLGVYASERLSFTVSERPLRESQGQNRNRESRPSGIVGGPRETSRWWKWEPTSQPKGRGWQPSTSPSARP